MKPQMHLIENGVKEDGLKVHLIKGALLGLDGANWWLASGGCFWGRVKRWRVLVGLW